MKHNIIFSKRMWFAAILCGAVVALSGCMADKDSMGMGDNPKGNGGGRPDPNSVRIINDYERDYEQKEIRDLDETEKIPFQQEQAIEK
jgi:hypothetical protein